jgi:hypothetical protein
MKWIWGAAEFIRRIRHELRFGERSRAPLKLVRLELRADSAECEWLARANDPWDADFPLDIREENETLQALHDALAVREFLFSSLPEVHRATVKVYRATQWDSRQLIITGSVSRDDEPPPRVASLVMRAKLCGFRFNLLDGAFESLSSEISETNDLQLIHQ